MLISVRLFSWLAIAVVIIGAYLWFHGPKLKSAKKQVGMSSKPRSDAGSAAPYLIAWLMGVPGSLLFLIFIVRGCH